MKIDLFEAIKEKALAEGSLYRGNKHDKQRLTDFLEMNSWFGCLDRIETIRMGETSTPDKFMVDEADVTMQLGHLDMWLKAYKKSNREKLMVLAEYGRKTYPVTTSSFVSFVKENGLEDETACWRLLDYLLSHLEREIIGMPPVQVEAFVSVMDREASLSACELFADFYEKKVRKGDGWIYRFAYRSKKEGIRAYPFQDFARMQYCAFNDENWTRQSMLEKACSSPAYANLWAYISLHFVCALRGTDIERLPKPGLLCPGEEFRRRLLSGEPMETGDVARELKIRLKLKPLFPNKTKRSQHVPELKVPIPVSLEEPVGLILAVAASFREDIQAGQGFLQSDTGLLRIRNFFGKDFADALGGKRFSTNRANKSYLQGLEMAADARGDGKPKGYMLAALARSHKGGIASFPTATETYLKDAAFTGYSPQFIAREMFERGIFGFIPHLLLSMYGGKNYRMIGVHEQTELIRAIGMKPYAIEELVRVNQVALLRARKTLGSVISRKKTLSDVLQRIAAGEAAARDRDALCLMTACGYPCADQARGSCSGCRYEIYTKALLHGMVSEHMRLKQHFEDKDGWRYRRIAAQAIKPMVMEYLCTMKNQSSAEETEILKGIMEGGLRGYDCCSEQPGGAELQPVPDGGNP